MGSYESAVSYDSTWEEDEDNVEAERSRVGSTDAIYPKLQKTDRNMTQRRPSAFNYKYMYSEAAHIMCNYRNYSQPSFSNYHSIEAGMPNLMFYRNQKKSEPDGLKIDDLLSDWKDKYDVLEMNHCYIQWLFPNREPGKNSSAHPLHEKEIEMMKNDKDVKRRLREAYQMMLGFYGLQLLDEDSGQVGRAENWKERYRNLDRNSHNNLRITRILNCLGDLGYEHYQEPLTHFFLEETLRHGNLQSVKRSVLDYYVFSVRDKKARQRLVQMAWDLYEPKSQFIWGPVEVLQKNSPTTSQSTYKGDPSYVVESEEDIPSSYCCSCNCKM